MVEKQQDLGKGGPDYNIGKNDLFEAVCQGAQFFGDLAYRQFLENARGAERVGLTRVAEIFSRRAAGLKQEMISKGYTDPAESLPKVKGPSS